MNENSLFNHHHQREGFNFVFGQILKGKIISMKKYRFYKTVYLQWPSEKWGNRPIILDLMNRNCGSFRRFQVVLMWHAKKSTKDAVRTCTVKLPIIPEKHVRGAKTRQVAPETRAQRNEHLSDSENAVKRGEVS